MLNNKKIQAVAAFLALVVSIVTSYVAIDTHYAKAEEFKKLELRLDQKIRADRSEKLQERIWKIEDRYPDKSKIPPDINDNLRIMNKELKENDVILRNSIGTEK